VYLVCVFAIQEPVHLCSVHVRFAFVFAKRSHLHLLTCEHSASYFYLCLRVHCIASCSIFMWWNLWFKSIMLCGNSR